MSKRESPDAMLDKMVLAATLYYKEKLSQQEIAKRLNVSRPWVCKLLSRAEDLGIVKNRNRLFAFREIPIGEKVCAEEYG